MKERITDDRSGRARSHCNVVGALERDIEPKWQLGFMGTLRNADTKPSSHKINGLSEAAACAARGRDEGRRWEAPGGAEDTPTGHQAGSAQRR